MHVIALLIHIISSIIPIRMDGWRIDVGYPEDREEAERRLQGDNIAAESEATGSASE